MRRTIKVESYSSSLVETRTASLRPVVVHLKNEPVCLVMADEFLLSHEIRKAYADHTGFDYADVECSYFGVNILRMEKQTCDTK